MFQLLGLPAIPGERPLLAFEGMMLSLPARSLNTLAIVTVATGFVAGLRERGPPFRKRLQEQGSTTDTLAWLMLAHIIPALSPQQQYYFISSDPASRI